jgi:hypothetical protein
MTQGAKFVSGEIDASELTLRLTRSNGSSATLGVLLLVQGVSLVDNADSTFDLDFLTGS